MTITPERAEVLHFSPPYYYTPAAIAVHEDNTTITERVRPRRQEDRRLRRMHIRPLSPGQARRSPRTSPASPRRSSPRSPIPTIKTYDTDSTAIQDLALGDGRRLDAVISALPTLQAAIDAGTPIKIVGQDLYYEPLSVAVDKSSRARSDQPRRSNLGDRRGDARGRDAGGALGEVVRHEPHRSPRARRRELSTGALVTTSYEGRRRARRHRRRLPRHHRGRRERLELLSARVPFRLKLAAVWALILGLLVALFAAADFDTAWMRENAGFIARGHHVDDRHRRPLDRARLHPRAPRCARAAQPERDRRRRHGLLHVVLPRHAADRPAVPDLPRAAADRDRARRPVGGPPHPRRPHRRCPRAGTELRRLHDGDLPRGHPVGRARPVGGRRGARHDATCRRCGGSSSRRRFRVIIPPTGNEFIAMMKDTALVSFLGTSIAQMEIFRRAQLARQSRLPQPGGAASSLRSCTGA